MGMWHVATSLVLAGAALYALGIPLAWLMPAPARAQWVHRIAIAPVIAIAVTSPLSWILHYTGIAFHPWMLVVLAALAWAGAWRRNHETWRPTLGLRDWGWPLVMVAASAYLWWLSLMDRGLYLPNRDFKNHAYIVAQFALDRTVDPINTLATGPLASAETAGAGRVGLHTLLAWALPTTDWNSLGVTAAAAVVATAVSLPLGLVSLARIWLPDSTVLWKLTGMGGVVVPLFTSAFGIGSVSLLVGTAFFPAALAALWELVLQPSASRLFGVLVVGAGLAFTHLPEAAGFGILVVVALPAVLWRMTSAWGRGTRSLAIGGAVALVLVPAIVMFMIFPYLSEQRRDIQVNEDPLWVGVLYPLVSYPSGPEVLRLAAFGLLLLGIWMALRERLRPEPLVVLMLLAIISVAASWSGAPAWLRVLATPWYGTAGRVSLLAGGPVMLLICLPLSRLAAVSAAATGRRSRAALVAVAALGAVVVAAAFATDLVEGRRYSLSATLAGAGDTPAVAAELKQVLAPGESVVNLEGDGSANLFAAARVPTTTGLAVLQTLPAGGEGGDLLTDHWLDLSHPAVEAALEELGVRYFAMGTANVFWGSSTGYDEAALAAQPQLTPVLGGTDVTVYRYEPVGGAQ